MAVVMVPVLLLIRPALSSSRLRLLSLLLLLLLLSLLSFAMSILHNMMFTIIPQKPMNGETKNATAQLQTMAHGTQPSWKSLTWTRATTPETASTAMNMITETIMSPRQTMVHQGNSTSWCSWGSRLAKKPMAVAMYPIMVMKQMTAKTMPVFDSLMIVSWNPAMFVCLYTCILLFFSLNEISNLHFF